MKPTKKELPPEPLYSICRDCAEKRGWEPVSFPVGVWTGECEVCGETKLCTAQRDYKRSPTNPYGR